MFKDTIWNYIWLFISLIVLISFNVSTFSHKEIKESKPIVKTTCETIKIDKTKGEELTNKITYCESKEF